MLNYVINITPDFSNVARQELIIASGFHKLLYAQKNVRQNFGNCKCDYPSSSNLYSSVCSVGVTFGKPNSGTVVSEGQDVLLHFQLRGIYRAPNKMSFF